MAREAMELGMDPKISDAFARYQETGDRALRNWLIEQHVWLAAHCARRFVYRGEPADDLQQVAYLGLLKAVERYRPDYGTSFATFAVPTILGELRRHFRDRTWSVHVPRRVKDRYLDLAPTIERLTHRLGRSPSPDMVAAELRLTVDEVLEALEVGANYRALPITPPTDPDGGDDEGSADGITLGMEDDGFEVAEVRLGLRAALSRLSERDRTIVRLRFFADLTQTEIAEQVGISQVHVSRVLRHALAQLQHLLPAEAPHRPPAQEARRTSTLPARSRTS
jgi:RNA polymerase sigma-B factor